MNLLQEYKELYYKEIEFNDRLNNKITTCITFLTILGSAQILLWTQMKTYLTWYTLVYVICSCISSISFIACVGLFFRTYSGYKTQLFPIRDSALQNMKVLNEVEVKQKHMALEVLEMKMAERFINDAIHNRKNNIIKNNRHRTLIKAIMIAFIFSFIAFAINVGISSIEAYNNANVQINMEGGETNVG